MCACVVTITTNLNNLIVHVVVLAITSSSSYRAFSLVDHYKRYWRRFIVRRRQRWRGWRHHDHRRGRRMTFGRVVMRRRRWQRFHDHHRVQVDRLMVIQLLLLLLLLVMVMMMMMVRGPRQGTVGRGGRARRRRWKIDGSVFDHHDRLREQ